MQMQYDFTNLYWCIPGTLIVGYGLVGIAKKKITTYGRGGRRDVSNGKAAVRHGIGVVLFGLTFIVFGLLLLISTAHA